MADLYYMLASMKPEVVMLMPHARYIFLPFCILTFWVNSFGRVCQLPFPLYFVHSFIDQTFDSDHGQGPPKPVAYVGSCSLFMFILKSTELRFQFSLAWSVARHLAARGQNLTSYARSLPVGESVNEQRRGEAASELNRQHFHFFSSSPPAATHAQNRRPFQR